MATKQKKKCSKCKGSGVLLTTFGKEINKEIVEGKTCQCIKSKISELEHKEVLLSWSQLREKLKNKEIENLSKKVRNLNERFLKQSELLHQTQKDHALLAMDCITLKSRNQTQKYNKKTTTNPRNRFKNRQPGDDK
jgi:hypothetical protein